MAMKKQKSKGRLFTPPKPNLSCKGCDHNFRQYCDASDETLITCCVKDIGTNKR